jgi:hypothetical protein
MPVCQRDSCAFEFLTLAITAAKVTVPAIAIAQPRAGFVINASGSAVKTSVQARMC